jgi:hypothetical protein
LRRATQSAQEIAASLTAMEAGWLDDTASRIIHAINSLPEKKAYGPEDIRALLESHFEDGKTVCRLFIGLSKDELESQLSGILGPGKTGSTAFRSSPDVYLKALMELGVAEKMSELINTPIRWSDLLIERLRSGRGRAIRGEARGRSLEDFVESCLREHFEKFDSRCLFVGKGGHRQAKADFAIPSRDDPLIVIEVKGYAATGSKQTDVLGDLRAIVDAKRHDTVFLFVTDGLTWRQRMSDLKKIVEMQNQGEIGRIYTRAMREELGADLESLKLAFGI